MRSPRMVAIVAGSLIALGACAPAAPPVANTAADEAVFRAGTTTWIEAYNAGQVDRIVALYAEDAVMMPPNAPAALGHAAMQAFLTADIAATKAAGLKLAEVESQSGASGNLGWHSGTYKVTDSSGATVDTGNYVETWRKTEGKWLIIRDTWHSDRPVATKAS